MRYAESCAENVALSSVEWLCFGGIQKSKESNNKNIKKKLPNIAEWPEQHLQGLLKGGVVYDVLSSLCSCLRPKKTGPMRKGIVDNNDNMIVIMGGVQSINI